MSVELLFRGSVAGTSFEPAKTGIQKLASTFEDGEVQLSHVRLAHNPNNAYDQNAIEVYAFNTFVGHIPKSHNQKILQVGLDKVRAQIERFNVLDGRVAGLTIEVTKI